MHEVTVASKDAHVSFSDFLTANINRLHGSYGSGPPVRRVTAAQSSRAAIILQKVHAWDSNIPGQRIKRTGTVN